MKRFSRGMSALLAVLLIFSSSITFAAKPNAVKTKAMNQGMIKSMVKAGLPGDLEDLKDSIKVVDLKALPMASPNVVRIVGTVEIDDDDFTLAMFKGKTKLKLKFGNVTVNVDKFGDFKQTMPVWKLEGLVISLYMGHVFIDYVDQDMIDEMDDPIPVDRALARAIAAVDKLPDDLEDDLTIEHRNLVIRARTAVDMLKAALDAADIDYGATFNKYKDLLKIVEEAEDIMEDLMDGLIEWDVSPRKIGRNEYSGELDLNSILPSRVEVLVEFEEAGEIDLELTPNSSGRFYFESDTNMDIVIRIFLDGIEIEDLKFTID